MPRDVLNVGSMRTCKDVYLSLLQLWLVLAFQASSLQNVALLGTATQSSSFSSGSASNAIDGNRNPEWDAGSCTHTMDGPDHWWSLLLPEKYSITHVNITNRNQLPSRINNAEILIGNSQENNGNNNPRCSVITSIPASGTHTYNCRGMVGQLVNVKLFSAPKDAILTICELEVYGEPAAPSFSAVVMGRSVAVVEKKLCWSDALFYCRDFYWDLLSIRSEAEQREVENVLRSVSFPLTGHVWLGLRRYIMDDTWFWMSGTTENYFYWETMSSWKISSPCGAMDTSSPFHWRNLPCEEHLHFICLKDNQGDTNRVEFFSTPDHKHSMKRSSSLTQFRAQSVYLKIVLKWGFPLTKYSKSTCSLQFKPQVVSAYDVPCLKFKFLGSFRNFLGLLNSTVLQFREI